MNSDRLPWHADPEYTAVCHRADMDGLGCALLLDRFTEVSEITFADFPLPADLGAGGKVVVCDLNLPPDSPAWQNPDLVVFDHHGEAPEGADVRFDRAYDDGDACGTALLEYYLFPHGFTQQGESLRRFISMVNAGDLYLTDNPLFDRSRSYTWLLNKLGIERTFELARTQTDAFIDLPEWVLDLIETAREREDDKAYRAAMMLARAQTRDGLPPMVVTWVIGGDRSSVLGDVAEAFMRRRLIVGLCLDTLTASDGEPQITASIRDPEGRAREVAEAFGGGGHREAAGFTTGLDQALELWSGGET